MMGRNVHDFATSALMTKSKITYRYLRPRDTGIQSIERTKYRQQQQMQLFTTFPLFLQDHASALEVTFQTALTTMCKSVGKTDGDSEEQKDAQSAGTPFIVVGDGATVAD
jgi:hypothetical protein